MTSKPTASPTQRRLEAEMRRLGKRLDAVASAARNAEASVRSRALAQLRKLRVKQALAKKALARLGRQSAAASGPLKAGLHQAWRDIEAAARQARQRFRETA